MLDRDRAVSRYRGPRSEWFKCHGAPKHILQQIGSGTYYSFSRRGIASTVVLRFETGEQSVLISPRQSPHLLERLEEAEDEVEYRVEHAPRGSQRFARR
eukprot:4733847-Pleurochrysis_carterae.AAC.1